MALNNISPHFGIVLMVYLPEDPFAGHCLHAISLVTKKEGFLLVGLVVSFCFCVFVNYDKKYSEFCGPVPADRKAGL